MLDFQETVPDARPAVCGWWGPTVLFKLGNQGEGAWQYTCEEELWSICAYLCLADRNGSGIVRGSFKREHSVQ